MPTLIMKIYVNLLDKLQTLFSSHGVLSAMK